MFKLITSPVLLRSGKNNQALKNNEVPMHYKPTSSTQQKLREILLKCQFYRNSLDDLLEDAVRSHYERLKRSGFRRWSRNHGKKCRVRNFGSVAAVALNARNLISGCIPEVDHTTSIWTVIPTSILLLKTKGQICKWNSTTQTAQKHLPLVF